MEQVRAVRILRHHGENAGEQDDFVAHEEPLGIRIGGVDIAVVMRTPGHDFDLVRGFLQTEAIVESPVQIRRMAYCDRTPEESEENIVEVTLAAGVEVDLKKMQRNLYASSSCGVCGKATIENAVRLARPLKDAPQLALTEIQSWPETLFAGQSTFQKTGGLHGALLVSGRQKIIREDVGRHNAVDKVIGAASIDDGFTKPAAGLMVSGRVSFEIIQKAAFARIGVVAAVSAPTSLAVSTADALGITLLGFVRDGRANIYTQADRILS